PHCELPVSGDSLRYRFRTFLARTVGQSWGRSDLHAGAFRPWHLCACLRGGTAQRRGVAGVPTGGWRPGPVVVSASLADARVLAVPHRVDGARAVDGDLPGAVPEISARA